MSFLLSYSGITETMHLRLERKRRGGWITSLEFFRAAEVGGYERHTLNERGSEIAKGVDSMASRRIIYDGGCLEGGGGSEDA